MCNYPTYFKYQSLPRYFFMLLVFIVLLFSSQKSIAVNQAVFYVSPKGNDKNAGTIHSPFATIEKARLAVAAINKSMTGDIVVYLRGGKYTVASTINFKSEDSGTNGHSVVYTNYPNEKPVISCGTIVNGWKLDTGKIYKTFLGTNVDFRQLYVNGRREVRARTPNSGYSTIIAKQADGFDISNELLKDVSFADSSKVEMAVNILWMHKRLRIQNAYNQKDVTRAVICPVEWNAVNVQPQGSRDYTNRQFWLENSKAFLDKEGEWYFSKSTGYLYYMPRRNENINSSQIIIPTVTTLFNFVGTFDRPAHHIVISGLEIRYTNWTRPNIFGLVDVQANTLIPANITAAIDSQYRRHQRKDRVAAAISAYSASNIKILNNHFIGLGGNGVNFDLGGNNNSVIGNVFFDVSGSGVEVGNDAREPIDSRMRPVNDSVCNNYMAYIGQEYYGACGITAFYTDNCVINHNEIYHVSYCGISLGWGWSDVDNGFTKLTPHAPKNNQINYNRIDFVSEKLFDTGGIYTDNASDSSEIAGNYITNTVKDVGIFNDEYTHDFNIHDNVLEGNHTYNSTDEGWIRVNGTQKNNTYFNNSDKGFTPANSREIIVNAGLEKSYKRIVYSNLPKLVSAPKPLPTNGGIFTIGDDAYSETGLWLNSRRKGYNGTASKYAQNLGATVQWNPSLIEGKYKVAIYNIAENADPNAKLCIVHNGIEETKTINLNTGADGWIELGNFYFATGNNDSVSLTLMTAGKNVRVNAVRFTR
jgi:hypothetical protein